MNEPQTMREFHEAMRDAIIAKWHENDYRSSWEIPFAVVAAEAVWPFIEAAERRGYRRCAADQGLTADDFIMAALGRKVQSVRIDAANVPAVVVFVRRVKECAEMPDDVWPHQITDSLREAIDELYETVNQSGSETSE